MKRLRFTIVVCFFMALALLLVLPCRGMSADPVTNTEPAVDLSQLRDITGIERRDAESSEEGVRWWPWAVAGGVIVLASVAVWTIRRRRATPPLLPEQWALAEMRRIEALQLPEAGAVNRFHTLLSDMLRRYLEMRYQLPASRRTTPEFLSELTTSAVLPREQRELTATFLRQCDLAKFARADFSAEECQKALALARALVRQNDTAVDHDGRSLARNDSNSANRKARWLGRVL